MTHRWTNHLVLAGGIAIALSIAGVPILTYLPLLLFLACPLMMLVIMRAMAGHGSARSSPASRPVEARDARTGTCNDREPRSSPAGP